MKMPCQISMEHVVRILENDTRLEPVNQHPAGSGREHKTETKSDTAYPTGVKHHDENSD